MYPLKIQFTGKKYWSVSHQALAYSMEGYLAKFCFIYALLFLFNPRGNFFFLGQPVHIAPGMSIVLLWGTLGIWMGPFFHCTRLVCASQDFWHPWSFQTLVAISTPHSFIVIPYQTMHSPFLNSSPPMEGSTTSGWVPLQVIICRVCLQKLLSVWSSLLIL